MPYPLAQPVISLATMGAFALATVLVLLIAYLMGVFR